MSHSSLCTDVPINSTDVPINSTDVPVNSLLWSGYLRGVTELMKYVDNKWFLLQARKVKTKSEPYSCLQFTATATDNKPFISVWLLWDLLVGVFQILQYRSPATALLVRFESGPSTLGASTKVHSASETVSHQLSELFNHICMLDHESQFRRVMHVEERNQDHSLQSILVVNENGVFDIWLTGFQSCELNEWGPYRVEDWATDERSTLQSLLDGFNQHLKDFKCDEASYPMTVDRQGLTVPLRFDRVGRAASRIESGFVTPFEGYAIDGYVRSDVLVYQTFKTPESLGPQGQMELVKGKSTLKLETSEYLTCDLSLGYKFLKEHSILIDYENRQFQIEGPRVQHRFLDLFPTPYGPLLEMHLNDKRETGMFAKWKTLMTGKPHNADQLNPPGFTTSRFLCLISTGDAHNYVSLDLAKGLRAIRPDIAIRKHELYLPCVFAVQRDGTDCEIWQTEIRLTLIKEWRRCCAIVLGNAFLETHKLKLDFNKMRVGLPDEMCSNSDKNDSIKLESHQRLQVCRPIMLGLLVILILGSFLFYIYEA